MRSSFMRARSAGAAILVIACGACATAHVEPAQQATPANDLLNATVWMQKAVEYKANALSVYALATLRLDAALADPTWTARPDLQSEGYESLPPAVALDVDETVLDNSAYEAGLIQRGAAFDGAQWSAFVNSASSRPIPGALAFTQYAASKGVTVYFVTNRDAAGKAGTAKNLKRFGFPLSDSGDTLMLRNERPEWTGNKDARFAEIAKDHRLLLLVGDNFGDFSAAASGTPDERLAAYEADAAHFGHDWLMLANPSYGSWETAWGGARSLSAEQRRKNKVDALDAWAPAP